MEYVFSMSARARTVATHPAHMRSRTVYRSSAVRAPFGIYVAFSVIALRRTYRNLSRRVSVQDAGRRRSPPPLSRRRQFYLIKRPPARVTRRRSPRAHAVTVPSRILRRRAPSAVYVASPQPLGVVRAVACRVVSRRSRRNAPFTRCPYRDHRHFTRGISVCVRPVRFFVHCCRGRRPSFRSDMAHQETLKRPVEEGNSNNDNLNDDECDVTWGGKRSRYLYNYTLELPDSNKGDSDQTESVHSIQSKSTMEIESEVDRSSSGECGSNCCCKNVNNIEFELVSSSSSSTENSTSSSDSATIVDSKILNVPTSDKTLVISDNGYLADDTDIQVTVPTTTTLPPPACFRSCVECKKDNPNPYFQYCHTCFSYRMEFLVNKPQGKPRGVKRLNLARHKREYNLFKASQDISDSHKHVSQAENNDNLCNICLIMPKNAVFNHGKIGHIYCCYPCAKQLRRKSDKCPVCNLKVKFITKMISV